MNRKELVEAMALKGNTTKKEADKALSTFLEVVEEELIKGGKIQLVGFGTFEVTERAAREGRNPKTNEKITLPAKRQAHWKVGRTLKDKLNPVAE